MFGLQNLGILFLLVQDVAQAAVMPIPTVLAQPLINDTALTIKNTSSPLPHPLDATLLYHIPDTPITLYFKGENEKLPREQMQSCLLSAESWIAKELSRHSDGPMISKAFPFQSVLLKVYPRAPLTRLLFSTIIAAVNTVTVDREWTFVTHMTMTDAESGFLGYIDLTYATPRLTLLATGTANTSSVQLVKPSDRSDNLTSDGSNDNILGVVRPPNNYRVNLPDTTHVTLSMHDYGHTLEKYQFLTLLMNIQMSVITHMIPSGATTYLSGVQRWHYGSINFQLIPLRMTWFTLAQMVEALNAKVVSEFDAFEFDFEIMYMGNDGHRKLGHGSFRLAHHEEE